MQARGLRAELDDALRGDVDLNREMLSKEFKTELKQEVEALHAEIGDVHRTNAALDEMCRIVEDAHEASRCADDAVARLDAQLWRTEQRLGQRIDDIAHAQGLVLGRQNRSQGGIGVELNSATMTEGSESDADAAQFVRRADHLTGIQFSLADKARKMASPEEAEQTARLGASVTSMYREGTIEEESPGMFAQQKLAMQNGENLE